MYKKTLPTQDNRLRCHRQPKLLTFLFITKVLFAPLVVITFCLVCFITTIMAFADPQKFSDALPLFLTSKCDTSRITFQGHFGKVQ